MEINKLQNYSFSYKNKNNNEITNKVYKWYKKFKHPTQIHYFCENNT